MGTLELDFFAGFSKRRRHVAQGPTLGGKFSRIRLFGLSGFAVAGTPFTEIWKTQSTAFPQSRLTMCKSCSK